MEEFDQLRVNSLREVFSERELQLILNCDSYARGKPAGLPGHNLMLIISSLINLLGTNQTEIRSARNLHRNDTG